MEEDRIALRGEIQIGDLKYTKIPKSFGWDNVSINYMIGVKVPNIYTLVFNEPIRYCARGHVQVGADLIAAMYFETKLRRGTVRMQYMNDMDAFSPDAIRKTYTNTKKGLGVGFYIFLIQDMKSKTDVPRQKWEYTIIYSYSLEFGITAMMYLQD